MLREKCPYQELFWSVFSRIRTEDGEILRISPYSVRIWKDTDQNNFEYGHFLRSGFLYLTVIASCWSEILFYQIFIMSLFQEGSCKINSPQKYILSTVSLLCQSSFRILNCTAWKRKLLVAKKVTLTMTHHILEIKFFKIFYTLFFPKVCWQFLLFFRKKQNWNCYCEFSHLKFFNLDVTWQHFEGTYLFQMIVKSLR